MVKRRASGWSSGGRVDDGRSQLGVRRKKGQSSAEVWFEKGWLGMGSV